MPRNFVSLKEIEIDGQKVLMTVINPGRAKRIYGCDTFSHKIKIRYKDTRSGRLARTTEIQTRALPEQGDSIKTEWFE